MLGHWSFHGELSLFQEGPDKQPLSPKIARQTQSSLSCIGIPDDYVEICRLEQRE